MTSEAAKLAYRELEILARDARAALLEFGHTDDEITKASRGQMDGVTIPLADDRDQTTDQWRWLESLSAATRGIKAHDAGDYMRAEKEQANAQTWAIKARTASYVNGGYKSKKGASEGHTAVHGTAEEKQARWDSYQQDVEARMGRNPALSLSEARRQTAEKMGVSFSCIRNNTHDPRKK